MEVVNFIVYSLCLLGLISAWEGETLAVKGTWCKVKLHCEETGDVFMWTKHTPKTPRHWFRLEKVWYR